MCSEYQTYPSIHHLFVAPTCQPTTISSGRILDINSSFENLFLTFSSFSLTNRGPFFTLYDSRTDGSSPHSLTKLLSCCSCKIEFTSFDDVVLESGGFQSWKSRTFTFGFSFKQTFFLHLQERFSFLTKYNRRKVFKVKRKNR